MTPAEIQTDHQFRLLLEQVKGLRRQVEALKEKQKIQPEAEEILLQSLEEINVAQEELSRQNEEMLSIRTVLETERERYRNLFEFAPDGYLVTNKLGIIQEANQSAAELLKVEQRFLTGKPLLTYVAREDRLLFETEMHYIKASTGRKSFEIYLQPRAGLSFPVWVNVVRFTDREGALQGYRWSIRDITARRHADTEIKQSGQYFRDLYEEAPVMYVITTHENGIPSIADCNHQFLKTLGYTRAEVVGKPLANFYTPASRRLLLENGGYQRALARELPEEERELLARDGTIIPSLVWSRPEMDVFGRLTGTRATYVDISTHKHDEAALKNSQANLAALIENADARIWAIDRQYRLIVANSFYLQKVQSAMGQPIHFGESVLNETFPRAILDEWRGYYDRALGGETFSAELPHRYETELHLSEYRFHPIRDEQKQVIGVTVFERDITARKRTESALSLFKTVIEASQEAIAITDPDGKFIYINPAHERLFGRTLAEAQRMNYRDYYPPESLEILENTVAPALAHGIGWEGELDVFDVHGRRFPLWERADTILDADGKLLFSFGIMHDISERKHAERELEQSRERLHALSQYLQSAREEERTQIAREIHDEFGQALTALKMDLAWMEKRLGPRQAELTQKVRGMSALVDGTIQTVRRVATELRPGVLDNLGLVAAIEWQADEFQARTGLKCSLDLPEEISGLGRDQLTVLFRAFQEALTNVARHAEASEIQVGLHVGPSQISLVIQDNGKGILESQILDPKSLGLIGIRERIQTSGGSFEIIGQPKNGTTVRIQMPRSSQPAEGTP